MGIKGRSKTSIAIAGPAYRLNRDLLDKIGPKLATTAKEISKEVLMSSGGDISK